MVTIHDVARHVGVSAATVSNYLNRPEKVAPATTARIRAAVEQLGFVPSLSARQLRWQRSGIVGVSVINASNPFFADVVTAVERVVARADLTLVTGSTHESPDQQERLVALFEQLRFDGMVVAPSDEQMAALVARKERGNPVVVVDQQDPAGRLSTVSLRHREGGRLAAQHLVDGGRRRLLVATGTARVQQTRRRLEGVRDVVGATPGATLRVAYADDLSLEEGAQVGRRIAAAAPDERPDAVLAGNDMHALGLARALLDGGVRVPGDVALVGYDDIPFATTGAVPLTTVRQPAREIGTTAAQILLREIDDPAAPREEVLFDPELVVRQST
ncbi:LacI family transcriptional regulator [Isoptericola sp. 4D.3]|jgi:LacI family transcriptional regulator|uniref:LacI family transcriptional regulator n=1 Tax=Isoptericola peretonis TaxID=2918523 RepID=A0ABT0J2B5_9MICO|nr:LacI family transcriptional regulator [Isoptericola sp. 4D.3]